MKNFTFTSEGNVYSVYTEPAIENENGPSKPEEKVMYVKYQNGVTGKLNVPTNWGVTRVVQFIVSINEAE